MIQDRLNILAVLVVLIHPAECLEGYQQIVIELRDLRIHLQHIHKQLEFIVQSAGICLQLQNKLFSPNSAFPKKYFPVVHVDPLGGYTVDK